MIEETNEKSETVPTLQLSLLGASLIKHRGNFTFTFFRKIFILA
jgi:hypothetical protein